MEIFKLVGSIMVDSAEANKSIQKTGEKAEGMGKKLASGAKTAAKWAAGVVTAAASVGAAMVAATKSVASDMDAIDKGSQRMGISAERYQELSYAAGLCGVEMSVMEKAAKKLEGTDINMDNALKNIMSIGDETFRTQAAIDYFGESVAYELQPLLNAGAAGLEEMTQEAHDLGIVMSGESVTAGAAMNDMFSKVEASIKATGQSIIIDFFPFVEKILSWVLENMPLIREKVTSAMEKILPAVSTVLSAIMDGLPPLLDAFLAVVDALMPILQPTLDLISAALDIIVGNIKTAIDFVEPYLEPAIEAIEALISGFTALLNGDITGFFDGIFKFLTGAISIAVDLGGKIFSGLWDGMKSIWSSINGWIGGVVSSITDWFSGIGSKIASFFGFDVDAPNGSHAAGLPSVPYDGYKAQLHRGETVLNANDTSRLVELLQSGGGGDAPVTITIQNVLDGRVIGEYSYQYNRRKVRAMG